MLDWVAGVLASTKAATDITKGLVDLRTDAAVNMKAVELTGILLQLQQQLMTAQMEQMGLINKVKELEGQLEESKRRVLDIDAYELHHFPTGALAYVLSEAEVGSQRSFLCSNCFEQGDKVSLQVVGGTQVAQSMKCPRCATAVLTKAPAWMCAPTQ